MLRAIKAIQGMPLTASKGHARYLAVFSLQLAMRGAG
eukprot:CAMPEP_0174867738 /NCGR_PEP_ID=MMETSP1114-20130205/64613_1 /TAXON_ID=312471 /ORGANISM="Neobodo designis, Strain CCAP 1951/1" /LENGTH=36 /DNA_ID= /DNA_START= /DNA_END= /DNA_ORIENTATION=